jgi:hypothetical protein
MTNRATEAEEKQKEDSWRISRLPPVSKFFGDDTDNLPMVNPDQFCGVEKKREKVKSRWCNAPPQSSTA